MTILELKKNLATTKAIKFKLSNGDLVPGHFHVTEVGKISKHFIDCGGTVRKEEVANFQLWNASDVEHRLHPAKLLSIIELSEKVLGLKDLEIEVEYQGQTIEKFGLDYDGLYFLLTAKSTDCLAKEKCNIPTAKEKTARIPSCAPNSGCC